MKTNKISFIRHKSSTCDGFSLFELMIAIAIIAILTAIALPTYQRYIKKAAMTEMLQVSAPYRTAVELCVIEQGDFSACHVDQNGIPSAVETNYIQSLTVNAAVITLEGKGSLSGLSVTLTPETIAATGQLHWDKVCTAQNDNDLVILCQEMFKF